MTIRVLMLPHISEVQNQANGIARVIEGYFKYLPEFDIELIGPDATSYDLVAAHAGITGSVCDVAHLHGLYWTGDYNASDWEWRVNSRVIEACRNAKIITVPSAWVAETIQRDMRVSPAVVPHGIDWQAWQHKEENGGYILWNKNRRFDVCDNSVLDVLIRRFPDVNFVSTLTTPSLDGKPFSTGLWPNNFKIIESGAKTPHDEMRGYIQRAGVYLSVAKETFSIGVLEAMASGKPVLGWNFGGNSFLVRHGVTGYLAAPNDVDDLAEGLNYCLKHRKVLGANGQELAKAWTWQAACEMIAGVYRLAMRDEPASVSVVIPVYNKPIEQLERAIKSVAAQTFKPKEIIIIDDGTPERSYDNLELYKAISKDGIIVHSIRQSNQGVAAARNSGIAQTNSKYITCLDADDWLEPTFLEACIKELKKDRSLGIAYTSLRAHNADGSSVVSQWPGPFNPDKQLSYPKQNQVPTACVFRRDAWERTGGYRSRYCPNGAGSEDAAFWSAICSIGYSAKKVTEEALFNYSAEGGNVHGNREYQEIDWLGMYPWAKDGFHPFASVATPKRYSHPVRQYDQPDISVIIPVGPGHEKEVINALDSLEMQHFRKWEAIVVWDTGNDIPNDLKTAYPYVRWAITNRQGAGIARNFGVSIARAPLLFFLDADDVLATPGALDRLLQAWNSYEAIIYSDYLGKAVWDYDEAFREFGDKLVAYNDKHQTAVFKKQAANYDPALAQRQPEHTNNSAMPYYHWCLVSVLIPKIWHEAIGGFDELMETWEDVDYFWRLARAGYCFERVPEHLVMYAYHKGNRREKSAVTDEVTRQKHKDLIQYIKNKPEYKVEPVGCNCGAKRKPLAVNGQEATNSDLDNQLVMIEFVFPATKTQDHWGQPLVSPTGQTGPTGKKLDYKGYSRKRGDRFLVHVKDQQEWPHIFKLVNEIKLPEAPKVELTEPELIATDEVAQRGQKRRGKREKVAM